MIRDENHTASDQKPNATNAYSYQRISTESRTPNVPRIADQVDPCVNPTVAMATLNDVSRISKINREVNGNFNPLFI